MWSLGLQLFASTSPGQTGRLATRGRFLDPWIQDHGIHFGFKISVRQMCTSVCVGKFQGLGMKTKWWQSLHSLKTPACSASWMGGTRPICLLQFGAPLEISNTFCKIVNYCHVRESFHISGEFVSSEKLCFFAFLFFFFFISLYIYIYLFFIISLFFIFFWRSYFACHTNTPC